MPNRFPLWIGTISFLVPCHLFPCQGFNYFGTSIFNPARKNERQRQRYSEFQSSPEEKRNCSCLVEVSRYPTFPLGGSRIYLLFEWERFARKRKASVPRHESRICFPLLSAASSDRLRIFRFQFPPLYIMSQHPPPYYTCLWASIIYYFIKLDWRGGLFDCFFSDGLVLSSTNIPEGSSKISRINFLGWFCSLFEFEYLGFISGSIRVCRYLKF